MGFLAADTAFLSRVKTVEMIVMPVKLLLRVKEIVIYHLPAFIANATGFMVVLTTNLYGIQGRNYFMTIRTNPHRNDSSGVIPWYWY